MKWEEMRGDARERFCEKCQRRVTNLDRMTEAQRLALLASAQSERICVAYYQRLIANPKRPAATRRRFATRLLWVGVGALAVFVTALATGSRRARDPAAAPNDLHEALLNHCRSVRYQVEEWIDDARIRLGYAPKYRRIMMGAIEPFPAWIPPAPAATPPPAPATETKPAEPKSS